MGFWWMIAGLGFPAPPKHSLFHQPAFTGHVKPDGIIMIMTSTVGYWILFCWYKPEVILPSLIALMMWNEWKTVKISLCFSVESVNRCMKGVLPLQEHCNADPYAWDGCEDRVSSSEKSPSPNACPKCFPTLAIFSLALRWVCLGTVFWGFN